MKVGFYIPNSNFSNVDCRYVLYGNPGIGGTWHLFFIISSCLAQEDNGIDVFVFLQNKTNKLPEGIDYIQVADVYEALRTADDMGIDYFVINSNLNWNPILTMSFTSKIKLIPWCHNFSSVQQLKVFSDFDRVCKIVNVSREQMDLYRDHVAFSKMEYIYNCVPFQSALKEAAINSPFGNRHRVVTYIGSLVPEKSFHILASIWPDVLKEVPDSHLYVIGSGSLYNQNAKLGKYGIAESDYESRFMKYLTDSKGIILPSVHFMGKMGNEKFDILLKTKVGVPNPTGNTETFCLSAVEMQYAGCAVTAMEAPGYYDTFINGEIVKNRSRLVESIVRMLKSNNSPMPYSDVSMILEKKFAIDVIVNQWASLLLNMTNIESIHSIDQVVNKNYRYKWFKERLRILKANHKFLSFLPCVEYFLDIKESVIQKIIKLNNLDK